MRAAKQHMPSSTWRRHYCQVVADGRTPPQVNYLGHWLLARGLLAEQRRRRRPRRGARQGAGAAEAGTRVLFLSSLAHIAGDLDFNDLQAGPLQGSDRVGLRMPIQAQQGRGYAAGLGATGARLSWRRTDAGAVARPAGEQKAGCGEAVPAAQMRRRYNGFRGYAASKLAAALAAAEFQRRFDRWPGPPP